MMSLPNVQKVIAINDGIKLPKNKTAGVLPTEIFEKIFEFADALEAREKEEERIYQYEEHCQCDYCGGAMTHQEFDHMETTARDEILDDNIDHVKPDWIYCGVVCREKLAGYAEDCPECGDCCHLDFGDGSYFQEISHDEETKEKMGYGEDDFVCDWCVSKYESEDEDE